MKRVRKFLKEVQGELLKVRWPTREETVKMTLIVVGTSIVIGVFLGILDFICAKILGVLI